uniref:Protein kinase domain-containing protein n=1 Tax=Oryza meridionalis TaxID=40149 RepID=A0A0E0C901_9ORYZ
MPPGARARRIAVPNLIFLVFLRLASAYQRPSDAHIDCIDSFCLGGYTCSETTATTSCTAYLTFRSDPPLYSSPLSVAYLLNATPSAVAAANSVPLAVSPVDGTQLLLVPVPCSCNRATGYYQHNTTYAIQERDTFFRIANNTFQGLTTKFTCRVPAAMPCWLAWVSASDAASLRGLPFLRCSCYGVEGGGGVGDSSGMARDTPLVAAVRGAVETLAAYSYAEIQTATAGFAEERRVAAGSSVYRAVINGEAFAVKRVAAGDDVRGEVDILGRVNHSGLVRLWGLCANGDDTYLVLEFAENGALSEWLHPGSAAACLRRVLGWKQRVLVALDVTAGDDSIVLMTHHVVGTHGYLAPEYLEHGLISPKLDVFSFGVILLELLSGKTAAFVTDDDGQNMLLWQAADGLVDGDGAWFKLRAYMDPQLQGHYPIGVASAVAALGVRCVAWEPRARPSMEEVFVTLSAVYNLTVDWDPQNYSASASMVLGR